MRVTLSALEDVDKVKVELSTGYAKVTMKRRASLDRKVVEKVVEKAGFKVVSFKLSPPRPKNIKVYVAKITGMTSVSRDTRDVRRALTPLPGVDRVRVHFPTRTAEITMEPKARLRKRQVAKALVPLEFGVASFREKKRGETDEPPPRKYVARITGLERRRGVEKRLRRAISQIDGTTAIEIDLSGVVTVTMRGGKALTKKTLQAALAKTPWKVAAVTRKDG